MYEMVYPVFFWILVFEVFVFCLLNMPTPRGWKGKMIYFLTNSKMIKSIVMCHLIIIFLAVFFYIDANSQEKHFHK